jgi:hypothetical protein
VSLGSPVDDHSQQERCPEGAARLAIRGQDGLAIKLGQARTTHNGRYGAGGL